MLDLLLEGFQFRTHHLLAHMAAGLSSFLILLVIYHFATRERNDKIMGVLIAFIGTSMFAPLIDFILIKAFGWVNFRHTYIPPQESTREIFIRFLTFFGLGKDLYSGTLDVTIGPSVGMIISIFVILLLSFLYFFYKNEDVFRSIFFSFAAYFVLFMGSATYVVMGKPLELLGIEHEPSVMYLLRYHLLWILLLLIINFYIMRKDYFVEMLKRVRPFRLMHYVMMLFLGIGLGHVITSLEIGQQLLMKLIFTSISVVLAWLFAVLLDNLHQEDSFVSIPVNTQKTLTITLFFLAIIYSYAGGRKILFFILMFMGGSFFYSAPPFKLKKVPVISKLPIAVNSLVLIILGHSIAGDMLDISIVVPVFFLTMFFLAAQFTDIKKYGEDIRTLPSILGLKRAKKVIGLFFALAVFATYFILDAMIYLDAVFGAILMSSLAGTGVLEYYLINKEDFDEKPVFLVYLIILFLFIYLFFVI